MRRSIALLLTLCLLGASLCLTLQASETDGMAFDADAYKTSIPLANEPNTFEAWVRFPKNMNSSTRGGVIVGNFFGAGACINFEVHTNGAPRLYWVDQNVKINDWSFRNVNLYTGEWEHLTIVRDTDAGEVRCYVNATLAQTIKTNERVTALNSIPMAVGGDNRPGNAQYFKGHIRAISVYADVRTPNEIESDMIFPDLGDEELLMAYDFEGTPVKDNVMTDISGNGYDAKKSVYWIEDKEPVEDYAYSFAVIGDTQVITQKHPEQLSCIYDWIVDQVEEKNIQFVMGLGDITETSSAAEWAIATKNIAKLDGVVPYSLVRGNHDTTATFKQAFPYDDYADRLGGSYGGDMLNTWQELTVGEVKYLIMTLDYGAANEVLAWAAEVIEAHPEHNVIVTTHAYLYQDGTTLDAKDVCPPTTTGGFNNGDHMWDKLISQHENIVLVLSGHHPFERIVMAQDTGVHGNVVTQMLVDPQGVDAALGATGMVAMLYFSEDGRHVSVEYYSTVLDKYLIPENQFDFELAVVGAESVADEPNEPAVPNDPADVQTPVKDRRAPEVLLIAICALEAVAIVVLAVLLIKKKK